MKRLFDIVFSSVGLIMASPLFIVAAALVKLSGSGPVLFRQQRIGRGFVPFNIYKFRTMSTDPQPNEALITVGGDKRITRVGKVLRRYKIDELPQLFNVLKGEMSFVGPRPEVGKYVGLFESEYRVLLTVRPGITDPASLHFSQEEEVLAAASEWEQEYIRKVLPEKIRLSLGYVHNHSVVTDFKLMARTLLKIFHFGCPLGIRASR